MTQARSGLLVAGWVGTGLVHFAMGEVWVGPTVILDGFGLGLLIYWKSLGWADYWTEHGPFVGLTFSLISQFLVSQSSLTLLCNSSEWELPLDSFGAWQFRRSGPFWRPVIAAWWLSAIATGCSSITKRWSSPKTISSHEDESSDGRCPATAKFVTEVSQIAKMRKQ